MSQQASNPVGSAPAPSAEAPAAETVSQQMRDRYDDKGRLFVLSQDQFGDFNEFIGTFDETDPLVDWTGKAPEDATGGFAVVRTEDDKNRLIALFSKDAAFASPAVTQWLYTRYVRHVLSVASNPESTEAQFVSPDGTIKARYDLTAFKAQAMNAVKWLRSQGLQGMTVPGLKAALANAAFAATQFPRVKPVQWAGLLDRMIALADKSGHDVSLFAYWKATRDAKVDSGAEITFDFDDFENEVSEAEGETVNPVEHPTGTPAQAE